MTTPLRFAEQQDQSARDEIYALLRECTPKQQAGFHRIHDAAPWKGVANIPRAKLGESYELLRRTVIKNEESGNG